jgi:penicillin-binding protein 2
MKMNPFEIYHDLANERRTARGLDWEESALDSASSVEGFVEAETDSRYPRRSARALHIGIVIICLILVGKLFSLQIVQGDHLRELAEGNRLRNRIILAPRGQITDREGQVIARNTASFSLVAVPADLPKEGWQAEVEQLSLLLSIDKAEVMDKLQKSDKRSLQPIPLKQDLTSEESILFQTRAKEFFGFSVDSIPIREYPDPQVFSHLLGYTGVVSPDEIANLANQDYVLNDFIGKSGIELSYENYIRGIDGVIQTEVDASGKSIKVLGTNDPKPGNTVTLNINKGLQEALYQAFQKVSPNAKGAAIAMNPKTGEVLAFLSLPGFDNNLFAPGISTDAYKKLITDPTLPLFNRAIAGTYPPGSTVKPMVAAAALQEKIVTDSTVIVDRGLLVIPNQFNPGINYNFYGWKRDGLGPMTVRSAIAQSSDIYFYTVTGGNYNTSITDGLGAEKLADYYRRFHLGQPTGIDLQGEKSGLVADPTWKARYFKDDAILSKWYLGDTYHIGIGQGDMLVTPLQVALWTATIANNGTGMRPTLLKQVTDSSGKVIFSSSPQAIALPGIDPAYMRIVQEGMRETITSGSGVSLNTLAVAVAGKTGTSQFDGADPSRTHAWFTAYAPFDDPKLVITVLVEAGGEGHAAAVPIAKEGFQWCIANNCFNK